MLTVVGSEKVGELIESAATTVLHTPKQGKTCKLTPVNTLFILMKPPGTGKRNTNSNSELLEMRIAKS